MELPRIVFELGILRTSTLCLGFSMLRPLVFVNFSKKFIIYSL